MGPEFAFRAPCSRVFQTGRVYPSILENMIRFVSLNQLAICLPDQGAD